MLGNPTKVPKRFQLHGSYRFIYYKVEIISLSQRFKAPQKLATTRTTFNERYGTRRETVSNLNMFSFWYKIICFDKPTCKYLQQEWSNISPLRLPPLSPAQSRGFTRYPWKPRPHIPRVPSRQMATWETSTNPTARFTTKPKSNIINSVAPKRRGGLGSSGWNVHYFERASRKLVES